MCVNYFSDGIVRRREVSENHSQWAEESLVSTDEAGLLPNFLCGQRFNR